MESTQARVEGMRVDSITQVYQKAERGKANNRIIGKANLNDRQRKMSL